MRVVLETERLLLRETDVDIVKEMFELHSNEEVQRYTGEDPITSLEEMEHAIRLRVGNYQKFGYGRWATFLKDNMEFVGWAGLAYLPEFDEIDIGYRFLPRYWGKGIATEACSAILDYGFNTLQLDRIVAIAMKENIGSIRVMQKIGMQFEKYAPYDPGGEDVVWYACDGALFNKHVHKETVSTWNNIAPLYKEKFMDLSLYNDSYDAFCKLLPTNNSKVLELGCGPGNITKYLLSKRPELDILATDIAPNMIKIAQENNPTAQFEVMDARRINEIKKTFDGIVAGFTIPYLNAEEVQQFIKDAYHLLNIQGLLYLSFVPGSPAQSGYKTGSGGRVYFYYHELENIQSILRKSGFKITKNFAIDYNLKGQDIEQHIAIIAEK